MKIRRAIRLNKYLASAGLASRRGAEALIEAGRVELNGEVVHELAVFVEPGRDRVRVDGEEVHPPQEHSYLLLHKPVGVVTTVKDPEGRPTVIGLVPKSPRVFPVGRLDQDTSGLLLLTDDGDFAHRLLHPRYHLEKEYEAVVEGTLSEEHVDLLRNGIRLEGELRLTARAGVEILERLPRRTRVKLVLREGKKRQVRRMFDQVGHPVLQLRRVRFGTLDLSGLEPGTYRELTPEEVAGLRAETKGTRRRRGHPRRRDPNFKSGKKP